MEEEEAVHAPHSGAECPREVSGGEETRRSGDAEARSGI